MFERFTDRARHVVVLSQEEARGLNHNYIGTEHILLGLLGEPGGIGAQVLGRLRVTATGTREEVTAGSARAASQPGAHPVHPAGQEDPRALAARGPRCSHNYIGTEHILLGLVREAEAQAGTREGPGVAAQILTEHAGDLTVVRQAVLDLLPAAEALHGRRWLRRRNSDSSPASLAKRTSPASRPGCPPRRPGTRAWPKRRGSPGASRSDRTTCCSRRWPIRTARPPRP